MTTPGFSQQKSFVITAFGTKPDGIRIETKANLNGTEKAGSSVEGKAIIARGRFVSEVIYLKSRIELPPALAGG